MRNYSSEGIVLSHKNFGEADRLLIVLSKNYGKLSLVAKGVRKIKSKKRGQIEIFSKIKFSAVKGHGIDIMTEADLLNDYSGVRVNLNKISLAYYFCEVVNKITHEGEQVSQVFGLLSLVLEELEQTTKLKELRVKFIYDLLTDMGYWPIGRKLTEADIVLDDVIERKINSVRVGKRILK